MWTVIKIDKKKISLLKQEIVEKIGKDVKFYAPKLKLKRYLKSRILIKENYLLGDYLLCFHKEFYKDSMLMLLKYCKGLKYLLNNFSSCQKEIENFIVKCKENEDFDGYIKQSFFSFKNKDKFEFISGPFTSLIFSILEENKNSIKAMVGNYKLSVSKEETLFRPV